MILALIFLCLAIGCFSIREDYYQGKLKWQDEKKPFAFWGKKSWARKYKRRVIDKDPYDFWPPPKNWYYKLNGLSYKEKFPLSGSLLVWTTDGQHLFQALIFLFISLSLGIALELNWWLIAVVWLLVHLCHWAVYRLLQK